MNDINEEALRREFNKLAPELKKWGDYVDEKLNAHVSQMYSGTKEVVQFPAVCRVKDIDSFISKALYRNKDYKNPLLEITDKVGTRLVVLCNEAVKNISDYINSKNGKYWIIKEKSQDISKIRHENPEVFTYQSDHYIVEPCKDYQSPALEYLTCEIQIRTLLQHAYSEVSHAFVYKKQENIEPTTLRMLAASMAFIEEADNKFDNIFKMKQGGDNIKQSLIEKVKLEYSKLNKGYSNDKIDMDVLYMFVNLYDSSKIKEMDETILNFIVNKKDSINAGIKSNYDSFLFSQPTLLLALHSFDRWQNFTKVIWPFPYESLVKVVETLGYSDDVLD